jgi:hypothetical protein
MAFWQVDYLMENKNMEYDELTNIPSPISDRPDLNNCIPCKPCKPCNS